jgi:hypothetical protein
MEPRSFYGNVMFSTGPNNELGLVDPGKVKSFSWPMIGLLVVTAKMTDVDPQAWLADVLDRIAEHPVQRLGELLPWNWRSAIRNVDQVA